MMSLLQKETDKLMALDPSLKPRILFLTYGGSYAYGTNVEGSDVDLRGIALPTKDDVLLMQDFEEFRLLDETTESDMLLFSLHKSIRMLLSCNPNMVELLGGKPEFYLQISPAGEKLLQNKTLFLSRVAADTFSGYARGQLIRLNNALAKKTGDDSLMGKAFSSAVSRTISNASLQFPNIDASGISVYQEERSDPATNQVFANINMTKVPVKELSGLLSRVSTTVSQFTKQGSRNTKKDDAHLNKHAMHLVRLLLTGLDILKNGEIITYREKDHGLLMDIRNGKYRLEDGTFSKEFHGLVDHLSHELEEAEISSSLPARPDLDKVKKLELEIMEEYMYADH